jgi:hypothetical protein
LPFKGVQEGGIFGAFWVIAVSTTGYVPYRVDPRTLASDSPRDHQPRRSGRYSPRASMTR